MTDGMLDGGYYEQRIAALEAALTEAQKRGDQWATAFHRETEALLAENARLTDALHESQGWALNLVDQRDALATQVQKMTGERDDARQERNVVLSHHNTLATRCRGLELDKARLDWLDDNATTLWSVYGEIALGDDIREELDAAIKRALAASEPSTPICWRCQEVECECEPSTPK